MERLEPVIRPAVADDLPFVFDSWLNSWRTSKYAGVIRNCDYYVVTRTLIEDLLSRGAKLLVAELDGVLLGFVCGEVKEERAVAHYLYVKDPFLRRGVEQSLLEALPGEKPGFCTFYLPRFKELRAWQWVPEIARRKNL